MYFHFDPKDKSVFPSFFDSNIIDLNDFKEATISINDGEPKKIGVFRVCAPPPTIHFCHIDEIENGENLKVKISVPLDKNTLVFEHSKTTIAGMIIVPQEDNESNYKYGRFILAEKIHEERVRVDTTQMRK